MMLGSVYSKTVRERTLGTVIAVASVAVVTLGAVAAYADLEETIEQLAESYPEPLLALLGLSASSGATGLVISEMMNFIAPLVLCGIAISMGSGAIAGEEREGTLDSLIVNPHSRTKVALSKAGAILTVAVAGGALTGVATHWTVRLAGSSAGGLLLGDATMHLVAITLFFGMLALCAGAWSGNATLSNAIAVGVLIVSFLGAGLLPLIQGLEGLARIFPWYYLNAAEPLMNGVDWGHLGILIAASAALVAGAVLGVSRRDLHSGGTQSLLDVLRDNPRIGRWAAKLSGKAQVSGIWRKTLGDSRAIALVGGAAIFYLAVLIGPLFNALSDALAQIADSFPEAILSMVGFADLSTPEGFYVAEVFSLVVPGAVIAVTMMMGIRALAGEERHGTMDLLLTNPVSRTKIVLEKTAAMLVVCAVLGLATFAGTAAGNVIGGLGMSYAGIAAASLQAVGIGAVFGLVGMAASAALGRSKPAVYGAVGVTLVAYAANAFLPVSEHLADWARLSPFYYYLQNQPLTNGISWPNMAVMTGISAVLLGLSVLSFRSRDLRG